MPDDRDSFPVGLARAWEAPSAPRRGPRSAHTLADVVAGAFAIADADGLAAVSLHRVAARLGVTTNALYSHIDSKEELLVLLRDSALALAPEALPTDVGWRAFTAAWTIALARRFEQHPWLHDIPVRGAPLTPGPLRWLEALLAALDATGLDDQEQLACALLLESHARNMAKLHSDLTGPGAQGPPLSPQAGAFLLDHLRSGGFARLDAMLTSGGYATRKLPPLDEADFGLGCILDGIESAIRAHDAGPRGPAEAIEFT